jgi:hypothetical protein
MVRISADNLLFQDLICILCTVLCKTSRGEGTAKGGIQEKVKNKDRNQETAPHPKGIFLCSMYVCMTKYFKTFAAESIKLF